MMVMNFRSDNAEPHLSLNPYQETASVVGQNIQALYTNRIDSLWDQQTAGISIRLQLRRVRGDGSCTSGMSFEELVRLSVVTVANRGRSI